MDDGPMPPMSWKDKLLGQPSKFVENGKEGVKTNDLDLLEEDAMFSLLNGSPAIDFFEQIRQILFRDMENTMVQKLLGRNIGSAILQNKSYSMWKPMAPIHLMDIENGYFLVEFHNRLDCEKALSEGPWIIFDRYLTVQPWTKAFNPEQAFPSTVLF